MGDKWVQAEGVSSREAEALAALVPAVGGIGERKASPCTALGSRALAGVTASPCRRPFADGGAARPAGGAPGRGPAGSSEGWTRVSHLGGRGRAILDGYHYGYRTLCRNPAMTCGNVVGGTRFELVTSSVSGIISEPLTSRKSS